MYIFLYIIIAAVLINLLAKVLKKKKMKEQAAVLKNIPTDKKASFILYTFSMLGCLAAVDGEVSDDEIKRVELYINEKLQFNREQKKLALDVFYDATSSPLDLRDLALKFRAAEKDKVALFTDVINLLLELSISDGFLSPREDEAIASAATLFGISAQGYLRLKKELNISLPTIH
ncbi:TerB family tellurite resistance protein [Oligoflexia bacterium]|nr:TerB family tellurite resistance protein [Oligoflexia bacterium]